MASSWRNSFLAAILCPVVGSFNVGEVSAAESYRPVVTSVSPLDNYGDSTASRVEIPTVNQESPFIATDLDESVGVSEDCGVLVDCVCPVWYASAGMVILSRSNPAPGSFVRANPAGIPQFSGGDNFNFGWDLGVDATLSRRICNGDIVEARYFGLDSEATHQVVTTGNFIGAGFTGPGGTLVDGRYLSMLDSTEINVRRAWRERLTLLAGFRSVELKEELTYRLNNTVARGVYGYNNHMYGAQLGADFSLMQPHDFFQLNVVGKAGIFGNFTDGGIREFQGANFIGEFVSRDKQSAFVGEVGISCAYQLTQRVAIRGGYQMLWLGNVALSSNNASFSIINPSLLRTSIQTGDLFYHGATAGIDFVW